MTSCAEKSLKKLVEGKPNEWGGRIALSDLYRSWNKPKEALEQLAVDLKPSEDLVGIAGERFVVYTPEAQVRRAELAAHSIQFAKPEERDALRDQATKEAKQASIALGDRNPRVILVDAALARYYDKDVSRTLELLKSALSEIRGDDPAQEELLNDTGDQYVEIALERGQTGTARQFLIEQSTRRVADARVKIKLAQLYLRESDYASAREILLPLVRIAPDDPQVTYLYLLANKDRPVEAREMCAKLPEANAEQRKQKLRFSVDLQQPEIYERLMPIVLDESGSDPDAVKLLVAGAAQLRNAGEKDKAVAFCDKAIAKYPKVVEYERIKKLIQFNSIDEINKYRDDLIASQTKDDPYNSALFDGQRALRDGKMEDAIAALKKAAAFDPTATKFGGKAQEALWQIFVQNRRWDEADAMADVLGKANVDEAGGRIYRTRTLIARGKADEALQLAREVQKALPTSARAWVSLGMAQAASGQFDEAIKSYDVALAQNPIEPEALRGATLAARALGRIDDANRYVKTARAAYPNATDFELEQLNLEQSFGSNPEAVIARREEFAQSSPNNADFAYLLGDAYFRVARKKAADHDEKGAQEWLQKAIKAHRDGMEKFPTDLRFANDYATLCLANNDFDSGIKALEKLEGNPKLAGDVRLPLMRAEFLLRANKSSDARTVVEEVLKSDPQNVDALRALTRTYLTENRTEDALKALERGGEKPGFYEARVDLLTQLGRNKDALELLAKAQALRPDANKAAQRVELLLRDKQLDLARAEAEALIKSNPNNTSARWLRALIEMNSPQPNYQSAIDDLTAVRTAAPKNVSARHQLAQALLQVGRTADAQTELEATFNDNKDNRLAALRLLGYYIDRAQWVPAEGVISEARRDPAMAADAQLSMMEAQMYSLRKDYAKALAAAQRAVSQAPNDVGAANQMLSIQIDAGQPDKSLAAADQVLAKEPKAYWAIRLRATALAALKKPAEAKAEFKRLFDLLEGDANAQRDVVAAAAKALTPADGLALIDQRMDTDPNWRAVGIDLLGKMNTPDARERARALIDRNVRDAKMLGPDTAKDLQLRIYRTAGEFYLNDTPPAADKACEAYAKVIELGGRDRMSLNNYAYALTLRGTADDIAKAKPLAEDAYNQAKAEGFPNARQDAYIMDTYGWVLILTGDTINGMAILNDAATRSELPEIYYHLAEGNLRTNQKEAAELFAKKALDLISQIEQTGGVVDPSLKTKVDDVRQRAAAQ
ncbi:MAG: tetratricopeptide repeat protein [Tepidisphaeraceae bacterium]